MVQLKVLLDQRISFDNSEFQFLYGTIKRCDGVVEFDWLTDFNSSMVQLKEAFNKKRQCDEVNFNSSMVQLKVWLLYCQPGLILVFQFLYGTIKSEDNYWIVGAPD